jgi:hypothetical protein
LIRYLEERTVEDVVSQEKRLQKYIRENKKEAAVKLLFDLIVRHARVNHFARADVLREKLQPDVQ